MTVRERVAGATPRRLRSLVRSALRLGRRVGYARARWPAPIGTRPEVGLALCAIFRNEARYLAEWVTFHRLVGVERFYLYDNGSTDDWQQVLAPELAEGVVVVKNWPLAAGQHAAYSDCLNRHRRDTRWIAFIDIDEFVFSPSGTPLLKVLAQFDAHPGVAVNWRVYGPSGHVDPPAGLVTENYVMRVEDQCPINHHVKSFVYPRKTSGVVQNPHYFRQYGKTVGESGDEVASPFRNPATADVLRVNHYFTRSFSEFKAKFAAAAASSGEVRNREQYARYLAGCGEVIDGVLVPAGVVRDNTILQYVPALRAALGERSTS